MKTPAASLLFPLLIVIAAFTNASADTGEAMHNKSCTACHGTEAYTREDRKVKDMAGLKSRVRQCSYAIETKWFDEDINAVADFLNTNYYKF